MSLLAKRACFTMCVRNKLNRIIIIIQHNMLQHSWWQTMGGAVGGNVAATSMPLCI